jgi:hypothetical protein
MATKFWVGGTGTWNATNTANWAVTSGGAGGQSVPTSADSVTIDSSSGSGTITVATDITVISITFSTANNITLDFSVNNNNVTISTTFTSNGTGIRTLKMGNGVWNFNYSSTSTSTLWNIANSTNLTLDAGRSTIKYTGASSAQLVFLGAGFSYWTFEIARTNGAGQTTISSSNTFVNFIDNTSTAAHTIAFSASTTTTVNNFFVRGSSSGRIVLAQVSSGATMVKSPGGVIACDWMSNTSVAVTPATLTWYKGSNSIGTSSTGWIAGDPPSRKLSGAGVG